jgi:predicted metal-dependent phosphoesterase TrpH
MPSSGLRLDLHNHTIFSKDGLLAPAVLLQEAGSRGVACLAVTDHNSIEGALECARLASLDPGLPRVIPGIELATVAGEVIGLYVTRDIPRGLTVPEAAARIRGQGGLACLPHPYDLVRRGAIARHERESAAAAVDMVEVVNGRSLAGMFNDKALALAQRHGKPAAAGSDAHRAAEVGRAFVVIDALPERDTLLELLATGRIEHVLTPAQYARNWWFQALSPPIRVRRRIFGP